MDEKWLPLLLQDEPIETFPDPRPASPWRGLYTFVLNNSEPIKLSLWVVPLIILVVYVNEQRREAVRGQSRELASKAVQRAPLDALSFLLAVEAYRRAPTFEARQSLAAVQLGSLYPRKEEEFFPNSPRKDFGSPAAKLALSPDGHMLASSDSAGGEGISLWDVGGHRQVDTTLALITRLAGHESGVSSLVFSYDGQQLASGGNDGSIILWNVHRAGPADSLRGHSVKVSSLAFDREGQILASGGSDGAIVLWDLESRRQIRTFQGVGVPVSLLSFSNDGRSLVSAGGGANVTLWDVATGEATREALNRPAGWDTVSAVVFSPADLTLAIGSRKSVVLWDVARKQQGARGAFRVLNQRVLESGEISWSRSPTLYIVALAFSRDGSTLAIGYPSGEVGLIDLRARRLLGVRLTNQTVLEEEVRGIAFTLGDSLLVSVHARRARNIVVNISAASTDVWLLDSCREAGRNPSLQEWKLFFAGRPYRRTCPDLPLGEGVPSR